MVVPLREKKDHLCGDCGHSWQRRNIIYLAASMSLVSCVTSLSSAFLGSVVALRGPTTMVVVSVVGGAAAFRAFSFSVLAAISGLEGFRRERTRDMASLCWGVRRT